ncbi:MAG: hypothetical protein A3F72_19740 [Bacteroidetes bacterium RIFCSPLOWO2_12_FULL_35_15]|nr:MAG: hypothetical protein A3F72_19740 [Bacteroidetes bacterium RIFCSPLOWO2_12_FULL_35_15]
MSLINFSVEYYDTVQQNLFQGFPNAATLNTLVHNGMSISRDEFLAYMMFTEQDDTQIGYRNYDELSKIVGSRLGDIDNYLSFNNGSVQSKVTSGRMMNAGFTERLGVALGLCVVNKIHQLTAADWKIIPKTNQHKTFDFNIPIASTGTNFIQTENKGSVVIDNTLPQVVRHHYSGEHGIIPKKNYVRQEEVKQRIPIHQNLFYGTIGVLDNRTNSIAKVWLVDPPAMDIEMNPEKYKLLARLHYYLDEFRNIGVRENITKALEERIKSIEETKDYLEFDNKQLDGNFPRRGAYYLYMEGKMFAAIDTNEAFGSIFITEYRQRISAFIIAFPKAIMRLIVKQDFKAILEYNYNPDFINESVQVLMRISGKDMEDTKFPDDLKFIFNERKKYYEATYYGKVSHSTDGRIFGLLNEEQNIDNEKSS